MTITILLIFTLLNVRIATSKINHSGSNWAVLVAGSNAYYNYRHQSDVAHSYQILTDLGSFPASNIIIMMYDDVAWSDSNPFPGELYNEPNGSNVYKNINIDYSGNDVTADNFLSILRGIPIKDRDDLPVLNNTLPTDNIFIYYSDHGADGLVMMPTGDPLYAVDLHKTFLYMNENNMYNELVFYLESCESGSMFNTLLEDDVYIFATTASKPDESSYAYYFNDTLGTYMADEYSIKWMQDTTNNWNDDEESLITQFNNIFKVMDLSSPQKYGDMSFDKSSIHDFEEYQHQSDKHPHGDGYSHHGSSDGCKADNDIPTEFDPNWIPNKLCIDNRNVKLASMQYKYLKNDNKTYWKSMIENELDDREYIDDLFNDIIEYLFDDNEQNSNHTNMIKSKNLPINNWECLKSVYNEFENICETFTEFSLKYIRYLANLCNLFDTDDIIDAFKELCI